MSKGNLSKIVKDVGVSIQKHSPEILTGIGIAGMATSTILAVRATPKALILIEEKKEETGVDKLTAVNTIKATWKCYIPAAVVGSASALCLIGASNANLRRNAALATAYALSESTLRDYQSKVVEQIGEKKEKAVRTAVAKDKIDENPSSSNMIIVTGNGDTLCYDLMCHRYFYSNIDKLKKAENELNRRMRNDNYISLNEFYNEIGLDDVEVGYILGWNIDRGYIDLDYDSHLDEKGNPVLTVGFNRRPEYDFR